MFNFRSVKVEMSARLQVKQAVGNKSLELREMIGLEI